MNPLVSFLLLSKVEKPPLENVFRSLKENWGFTDVQPLEPNVPAVGDIPPFEAFDLDGTTVVLLWEDQPLDHDDVAESCARAWYWPEAAQAIQGYQGHLTVVVPQPPEDPLERSMFLTRVTAALAEATEAIAVIWPPAGLIHKREDFLNSARQMGPGQFPLELWVSFQGEMNEDHTLTFYTRGMKSFSLPEIEVYHTVREPQFVYERVYNIAYYLLENGPVIHDGETVGMSEDEHYHVTIGRSQLDPELRTLQVEM